MKRGGFLMDGVEHTAAALVSCLGRRESVAVAFSGGVDSAVVLKAAILAKGNRAVGVIIDSPSLPRRELALARETCTAIGARLEVLAGEEDARPGYVANGPDRCYHCKDSAYGLIRSWASAHGFAAVVNGSNADDAGDWRPGLKAAGAWEVGSPLMELRLGKGEVRQLARHWGLMVWDKPASPCLASRIPHGWPVERWKLARIEAAEDWIKARGYSDVRVRDTDGRALVEVPVDECGRLAAEWPAVVSQLVSLGFADVERAEDGLQSGRLTRSFLASRAGNDENRFHG